MSEEFTKQLNNPRSVMACDLRFPGRPLLVAFGGIIGKMGISPFEFFNLTEGFEVNKVYLRDLNQSWYHLPVKGLYNGVADLTGLIQKQSESIRPTKVITCGNSMGGYAALLFGALLNVDEVLAFSAQTNISALNLTRNPQQLRRVHQMGEADYFDLSKVLKQKLANTSYRVYFDVNGQLDVFHARQIESLSNVSLHPAQGGGHNLVRELRDKGQLSRIL